MRQSGTPDEGSRRRRAASVGAGRRPDRARWAKFEPCWHASFIRSDHPRGCRLHVVTLFCRDIGGVTAVVRRVRERTAPAPLVADSLNSSRRWPRGVGEPTLEVVRPASNMFVLGEGDGARCCFGSKLGTARPDATEAVVVAHHGRIGENVADTGRPAI